MLLWVVLFCFVFSFLRVFPGFLCWKCIDVPVWDVLAFTWVEARLGMYGWHQFSLAGLFTTVAEEEFKFNLHPFQRCQRNARERTPGLRPVLLSSTQPYWEVHPGSEHPTVGLSWFILTHCKLYEASSGPETSDFKNKAFLGIFRILSPFHTWRYHSCFQYHPLWNLPPPLQAESILPWASWSPRHFDPSVSTEAGSPWGQALCLSLSCSKETQCLLQSRDTIRVLQ